MKRLQLKRIRFSREADTWLKVIKSRTGLTPNLTCRIALSMSIGELGSLKVEGVDEDSDREINRSTLLGDFDALAGSLLIQWRTENPGYSHLDLDVLARAHINRGVLLLAQRVRSIAELSAVLAGAVNSKRRGTSARGV